jgi:hypothetical protein
MQLAVGTLWQGCRRVLVPRKCNFNTKTLVREVKLMTKVTEVLLMGTGKERQSEDRPESGNHKLTILLLTTVNNAAHTERSPVPPP